MFLDLILKFADSDKIQVKLTYDLSVCTPERCEFTGDVVLKNGTPIFSDRYYCPSDYDWMNDRPGDESHSILSTAALHLVYKDHYGIHLAHGHDGSFNQYAIVVEDRSGGSIAKTFEVMQSGSVTAVEFIGDGSKLFLPYPTMASQQSRARKDRLWTVHLTRREISQLPFQKVFARSLFRPLLMPMVRIVGWKRQDLRR